jgi:hypothetical protein
MRYSIHDKTLAAKKARILINALIDCAKAGVKSSFVIKKMLWGISLSPGMRELQRSKTGGRITAQVMPPNRYERRATRTGKGTSRLNMCACLSWLYSHIPISGFSLRSGVTAA